MRSQLKLANIITRGQGCNQTMLVGMVLSRLLGLSLLLPPVIIDASNYLVVCPGFTCYPTGIEVAYVNPEQVYQLPSLEKIPFLYQYKNL